MGQVRVGGRHPTLRCCPEGETAGQRVKLNHYAELREKDLNLRPSGYEPNELTRLLHPAFAIIGTYIPKLTGRLGDTVLQTSVSIARPEPIDVLQQRFVERTASGNTRSCPTRPRGSQVG